jgi:hypothetical protein
MPLDGSVHLILQFNTPPDSGVVEALAAHGVVVVGAVPVNGLLVTIHPDLVQRAFLGQQVADVSSTLRDALRGLGVRYAAPIDPSDKISPLVRNSAVAGALPFHGNFLVEVHADVSADEIRSVVLNQGATLLEHPDLSANHLLVHFSSAEQMGAALVALTTDDRVAYIFPASGDLVNGAPSRAYAAAVTMGGAVAQFIATNGDGWDGPGLNGTALSYFFSQLTGRVPAAQVQSEILRAMAEWSKVVKVTWSPGAGPSAARTVNIMYASGAHGDGFPFDGPGGVLAHTFYPAPPNPEPIAGDMHFDADESWSVGVNTDIFSVALHELGHALGLGHSDNPTDVMYPYYKIVTTLAPGDKAAIQTMYAAQDSAPPPPPALPVSGGGSGPVPAAPLTLTVQALPPPGTASTITLSGAISGGSLSTTVTWQANGASGTATVNGTSWTAAVIPLVVGANSITFTAQNITKTVSQTVTVTRLSSGAVKDTTAPVISITTPSGTSAYTTLATYPVSGTANDNVAVASVTWVTSTGNTGTATGTTNWSAHIPLLQGYNQVTVRATDTSGNSSYRSILITRQ